MSFNKQLQEYKKSTLRSLKSNWKYNPKYSNKRKASGGLTFQPKATKCSYKGISFDSRIEVVFYLYKKLIAQSNIKRNTTEYLLYKDPQGQTFRFYPDFIDSGTYIEVKGIVSSLDQCKRDQHPNVVWVVLSEQKQLFNQMEKVLDTFYPNWRKEIK